MIIIAILGLVVLVILVVIFSNKFSTVNTTIDKCFGGECKTRDECERIGGKANPLYDSDCKKSKGESGVCCTFFDSSTTTTTVKTS
ncbi:MAG: hypothetical protein QW594_03645 [Candidatus Woesearchaeota archaeon]